MKFTSEDLMKAMGLQAGDRIRVCDKAISATFEVTNDYGLFRLDHVDIPNARTGYELHHIFGLDFEILPRPKRVEDILEEYGIEDLTDLIIALDYYNHRYDGGVYTERVDKDEQH
jgi:hypothetical protein